MAIAFKSAGAGAGTETSGAALSIDCPATVDANDILIAHVLYLDATTSPSTPSGWTLLYGPANLGTGTPTGRAWVFGKLAVGNEDGTNISFGTAGGTSGRAGRIYSFSGYVSGTLAAVVPAASFSDIPSETDPQGPTVTTTVTGALACALKAQDDNNSAAAMSGSTGGTWSEAIAEFTSTTLGPQGCMLALDICTPTADPGTVSGGAGAGQDDENNVIGFEIRPNAAVTNVALNQASETNTAQSSGKKKTRVLAQARGTIVGPDVVADSYAFSHANTFQNYGTTIFGVAQSFTPSVGGPLSSASFWLNRNTGTAGSFSAKLYAESGGKPSGSALAVSTNSVNTTSLSSSGAAEQVFSFDGTYELQSGVNYVIAAEVSGLSGSPQAAIDTASVTHAGNGSILSNSGTWTAFSGIDVIFSVSVASRLSDTAQPFTVVQSAGGTVVALNQASETNTAQPSGKRKFKAIGQASSTETAQATTRVKKLALGQGSESDTAQPLAKRKVKAAGQAFETDAAQTLAEKKLKAFAQASETNTAQAFAKKKIKAAAQATETDTAQPFAKKKVKALAQASETDTAQAFTTLGNKIIALAQATETNTAQFLGRIKVKAFGQAAETDTAQAFIEKKRKALAQAAEADTAQAFTEKKAKALAQAAEADTAQALSEKKTKALAQALETDTAQAFTRTGVITVALNQAVEVDSVSSFTVVVTSVQRPSSGGGTAHQRAKWRRAAEHVLLGSGHGRLNARPEFLTFSAGADYTIKGHSLHASAKALVRLEAEASAFLTAAKPLRVSSTRRLVAQAGGTQALRSKPLRSQAGKLGRLRGLQRRARLSGQIEEGVVELKTNPNHAVTGRPKVVGVQNPSERELALMAIDFIKSRRKNR